MDWQTNPLPPYEEISKVEMLIEKSSSGLLGIRMYNTNREVIFTTGKNIEDEESRNNKGWGDLVEFEL